MHLYINGTQMERSTYAIMQLIDMLKWVTVRRLLSFMILFTIILKKKFLMLNYKIKLEESQTF